MKPSPTPLIALLLALAAGGGGCGYGFVRYDEARSETRRIAVITLENDSEEPGAELLASQALRHEILTRGGFELVGPGTRPHFTLRGRVLPIQTLSKSFTGDVLAREYQVTLRLELRVEADAGPGMREADFQATELYLASADLAVLRKNRQEALRYLSGLLARRAHDSMDRELLGVLH